MNYIELHKLNAHDIAEMIDSSLDETTTYWIADEIDGMNVTINKPLVFGFDITFEEETEDVYIIPCAELHSVRKFEVTIYDLEELHAMLKNEAVNSGIECQQDHDEPEIYHTLVTFPPIHIDSQQNVPLYEIMDNIMKQGEKLYAAAVVKAIDFTIKEAQQLREEFEEKLLG